MPNERLKYYKKTLRIGLIITAVHDVTTNLTDVTKQTSSAVLI